MLEPLPKPKEKNIPKYYGWTHSEGRKKFI